MTNRAWRAFEVYGADASITAAEFDAYKYDLGYSERSAMGTHLRAIAALDPAGDADTIAAQRILAAWDRRTDVANRGAALAVLTVWPIEYAIDQGKTPPTLRASLAKTIVTLKRGFGRLDPTWGEVNRIRRGGVDLAVDGGPDVYRAIYGAPQADDTLTAVHGDTLVMFVEWDREGRLSSRSIHQFGAATLDARSPHYADQTPLFVAMKTKPVRFTRAELEGHVTRDYRPGREAATPRP